MKFMFKSKDGGRESSVTGYWLIEWKEKFSIALLKFEGESRRAYHNHAFDAISWVLKGCLKEFFPLKNKINYHLPSLKPIVTLKEDYHMVNSMGTSWVFSIRGPWDETWLDHDMDTGVTSELTHGRVVKNRT